jgi:hypothetical protein
MSSNRVSQPIVPNLSKLRLPRACRVCAATFFPLSNNNTRCEVCRTERVMLRRKDARDCALCRRDFRPCSPSHRTCPNCRLRRQA